jgi:chemotaxis protein CheX
MDVRYINPFIVSCRAVFDQMIHVPLILGKPYLRQRTAPPVLVTVIIGCGGSISGFVVLRLSREVSLALASGLMGSPVTALDADTVDALGEIANMIAGNAKKDLPGGLATLEIPTVLLGDPHSPYPPGVPVIAIPFKTTAGDFFIEVAIRPTTPTPIAA